MSKSQVSKRGGDSAKSLRAKRSGVVNQWRESRQMLPWQEVRVKDYLAREIGPEISLRLLAETKDKKLEWEIFRFDAPTTWWREMLAGGKVFWAGPIRVAIPEIREILKRLDEKRPALIERASREAAAAQVRLEIEKAEHGERLLVE